MKVLLINGSPHENGCTYTALSLIAKELNDAGVDTEILHVGGKPVGGCIGCGGCAAGNGCVFGGVVNEAIEKAKTADGFVFGSPVHYASASGNMTDYLQAGIVVGSTADQRADTSYRLHIVRDNVGILFYDQIDQVHSTLEIGYQHLDSGLRIQSFDFTDRMCPMSGSQVRQIVTVY